jgi:uncharacterized protein (DUF427 family)
MSLTLGSGPFGHHPAGEFNGTIEGPRHLIYFEEYPRRIRAVLGGETVIDTVRGRLLYESSLPPVLYVPLDDVRGDLIEPTAHTTHCPFKGDAAYWTIRAGGRTAENALWGYPRPIESAPWLRGYVAAYWDRMDAWYEESEQLTVPLRDPYHRVEVRAAAARVTVRANGHVVAESAQPKLLFETSTPPRAYVPLDDVRRDLLVPSDKTSVCPYKGTARYWSIELPSGETLADVVWAYDEPHLESAGVAGCVSFLGEGIEVEVDRAAESSDAIAA